MVSEALFEITGHPPPGTGRFSVHRRAKRVDARGKPCFDRMSALNANGDANVFDWPMSMLTLEFVKQWGPGYYFVQWFKLTDKGKKNPNGRGTHFELREPPPPVAAPQPEPGNGAPVDLPSGFDPKTVAMFTFIDQRADAAAQRETARMEHQLKQQQLFYEHQRDRDRDFFSAIERIRDRTETASTAPMQTLVTQVTELVSKMERTDGTPDSQTIAAIKSLTPVANRAVDMIGKKLGVVTVSGDVELSDDERAGEGDASAETDT